VEILGSYAGSNLFVKRGVHLSLANNCYKTVNKVMGLFRINGPCKNLPKAKYILLFRTLYAKCEACDLEDFDAGKGSFLQLSLVYGNNRRLIVDETKDMAEVMKKARLLAGTLGLKIRDAATDRKNPVWLNP